MAGRPPSTTALDYRRHQRDQTELPEIEPRESTMTHLRYDIFSAVDSESTGPHVHPQEKMKLLGITYQHATPQSLADCWWFWNCENIPEELPDYLSELIGFTSGLPLDPMDQIGWGLSQEDAEQIRDYRKE